MRHAFFLAPAGSGVGLTTVALGLVSALDRKGVRVAFFKPIAQETEGDSGPERSTHFIRATTALQPADPIPLATATKTISEQGMDELMSQVIGAYGASTASADMVVVEGLLPALSDSYLGVVNHELVATLNAEVILVASQAHKSIEQLDDQIEYAAKAFGGLEKILGVIINRYSVDEPKTVGKFDRMGPIREQALSARATQTYRRRSGEPGPDLLPDGRHPAPLECRSPARRRDGTSPGKGYSSTGSDRSQLAAHVRSGSNPLDARGPQRRCRRGRNGGAKSYPYRRD